MSGTAHPWWCRRTEPGGGVHLSRAARAVSAYTGLTAMVQIAQRCPVAGYPDSGRAFVVLTLWCPEEHAFALDLEYARAVGWMLRHTGREQAVS